MQVTFYMPNAPSQEDVQAISPPQAFNLVPTGDGAWILQTYCFLRDHGCEVSLSAAIPKSGILVFHRRDKKTLYRHPYRKLKALTLVGVRGDLNPIYGTDYEVLQNGYFADGIKKVFIPHWSQPSIQKRNPQRGNQIKRICFKGNSNQLHSDFTSCEWLDYLQDRGIEWVNEVPDFNDSQFDYSRWSDYREIDLLLAIRPDQKIQYKNKPASKLTNSWLAECPCILAREYAYRETGQPGIDYIEASTRAEAEAAIDELIQNPAIYQSLIHNGKKKVSQYQSSEIIKSWIHLLYKKIPEDMAKQKTKITCRLLKLIPLQVRSAGMQAVFFFKKTK